MPGASRFTIFCALIVVLTFFFLCSGAVAQEKKDVSDPVLAEILSYFNRRMPRFINQHGREVFVADGPVTRGGLLSALYEYDRSLKFAGKDDFTDLKEKVDQIEKEKNTRAPETTKLEERLAALEKKFAEKNTGVPEKTRGAPQATENDALEKDISKIQTKVAALDSSFAASNVSLDENVNALGRRMDRLEEKVFSRSVPSSSMTNIERRIEILEKGLVPGGAALGPTRDVSRKLDRVEQLENKLNRMEERIDGLGGNTASVPQQSRAARQDLSEYDRRLERVEDKISDFTSTEKQVSKLEEKINSIERVSSLASVTSSEEISELKKRIEELERLVGQKTQEK